MPSNELEDAFSSISNRKTRPTCGDLHEVTVRFDSVDLGLRLGPSPSSRSCVLEGLAADAIRDESNASDALAKLEVRASGDARLRDLRARLSPSPHLPRSHPVGPRASPPSRG